MTTTSPDLVIVGAGAAGLAAATAARSAGIETVLLEAMDRIGGRAWTDTETFGVPWDRGCHWLHSADINPFTPLADAYGFPYRMERAQWRTYRSGGWLTDGEEAAADVNIERVFAEAIGAGRDGVDRPLSAFVTTEDAWVGMLETAIHAERGFGLDGVSTLDIARYRDTHENWPLRDGYGALVARHHAGVDVTLSTPVTRIDWGGPRVEVDTHRGSIDAAAVLLTVSTGVLADERIIFDPPLPEWKRDSIAAVPLGRDNKAAFQLKGGMPGIESQLSADIPFGASGSMSIHVHPFGTNLVSVYLGGPVAAALEVVPKQDALDAVADALVAVFGPELRGRIVASTITAWGHEPFVRGAYAAARPGASHLRRDLGTAIDGRLFFAGEATHPEFFTTCHGAHLSGIAAVADIAMAATESR